MRGEESEGGGGVSRIPSAGSAPSGVERHVGRGEQEPRWMLHKNKHSVMAALAATRGGLKGKLCRFLTGLGLQPSRSIKSSVA